MCGFAGLVRDCPLRTSDPSLVEQMTEALRHRGPDDHGFFTNRSTSNKNGIALGHRRLSIIDLENGREPIIDPASGIVLVFNGEIYNFRSLRREARKKWNYSFQTETDPEVILPLYRQFGAACVERLRGMFSFAIWDPRRERLLMARDRVGQKPLFYRNGDHQLRFASELAPLAEASDTSLSVSRDALQLYMVLGYIPAPHTIYNEYRKLPPGTVATWSPEGFRIRSYWNVPPPSERGLSSSTGRLHEVFMDRFRESVELRLQSDVPLGAFLSGGIDSSAVVSTMSRLRSKPVKTFAMGFDKSSHDETSYARMEAEHAGTDHHQWNVRPSFLDLIPKLARHYGEPFGDSSAIPTYVLSKRVSDHVKVALSGDGGDECFGGYNRYRAMRLLAGCRFLTEGSLLTDLLAGIGKQIPTSGERMSPRRIISRLLRTIPGSRAEQYLKLVRLFSPEEVRTLLRPAYRPEEIGGVEELHRELQCESASVNGAAGAAYTDFNLYLPSDLLVKLDIASMANGLEVRCPFLDHRMIEFSARVPFDEKMTLFRTKTFLRNALKDQIPEPIRNRSKMGFGVPISSWLRRGQGRELLLDLKKSDCVVHRYFNEDQVRVLVDRHLDEKANYRDRLWLLLMFQFWYREFMA